MSAPSVPVAPVEVPESVPVPVAAHEDATELTPKKLSFILKSNDGEEITVEQDVALQSNLIKKMVADLQITDPEDKCLSEALPVSNLDAWTLKKVLEWCEAHKGEVFVPKERHENPETPLTEEDKAFLAVDSKQLGALVEAADYLEIPALTEKITQKIADMCIGKSIEQIREIYSLPDDYTPSEKVDLKKKFEFVHE